jgi:hypothetical protein
VREEVGTGKMTVVHKAIDDDTGKILAVKFFSRLSTVSEDARRRVFLREEAAILAIARDGVSKAPTDRCVQTLPLSSNTLLSLISSTAGRCEIWKAQR